MGTLEGLRGRGRSRERTEGGSSDEELKRSKVSNTTVQGPRSHVSTVGLRDHADMRWGVAERSRGGFLVELSALQACWSSNTLYRGRRIRLWGRQAGLCELALTLILRTRGMRLHL